MELSVQAAADAELDLGLLPRLRSVAGEWALIGRTLSVVEELEEVITWPFGEGDLHAFRDHFGLLRLTIKNAPRLRSLSGLQALGDLEVLKVLFAPRLGGISDVTELAASLRELELQNAKVISEIEDVKSLINLCFLGVNDCGDIASIAPIESLLQLETFHAWESTRVVDEDLSPLTRLPRLKEVDRRPRGEDRLDTADGASGGPTFRRPSRS